jgi:LemA protein
MSPLLIALAVGGFVVLLVVLWVVSVYNGLVRSRNETKNGWSQIDVQLKRRHDLIPNLVETVRGYATHERQTLEAVIAARNQAVSAQGVGAQIQAEGALGAALGRLMVVTESYPDLKANANFLSIQEELTSTENKIGFARQYYNDTATNYNTKLEMFPGNMVAGAFGFQPAPLFQIERAEEREVPKVKF